MRRINKFLIFIISFFGIFNLVYCEEVEKKDIKDEFNFNVFENVQMDDEVRASSLVIGKDVVFNSIVKGINLIISNNVVFSGVSEYAFLVGSNVNINGKILNDGVIVAGEVEFSKDSLVDRDILIFAEEVMLSGSFNRNVLVFADYVSIEDASIGGNIKIKANNISVDKESSVVGSFKYNENALFDNDNSKLMVKTYSVKPNKLSTKEVIYKYSTNIISSILLLLFSLIIFPKLFNNINKNYLNKNSIFKSFGIGLIILITIPVISLILLLSSIGSYVGVVLLIIYVLMLMLSFLFTDYTLGRLISNKLIKKETSNYLSGVIGIIIMFILKLLPVIGILFVFMSVVYGMGLFVNLIMKTRQ